MIINPTSPWGDVIFCDDIRHEVTGKLSLIGVYGSGLMIAAPPPITLPQLCAVIRLRVLPPTAPFTPIIRISRSDNDDLLAEIKAEIEPVALADLESIIPDSEIDSIKFMEWMVTAHMQGIVATKDFSVRVRAHIDDDEVRIGTLQVRFAQPH